MKPIETKIDSNQNAMDVQEEASSVGSGGVNKPQNQLLQEVAGQTAFSKNFTYDEIENLNQVHSSEQKPVQRSQESTDGIQRCNDESILNANRNIPNGWMNAFRTISSSKMQSPNIKKDWQNSVDLNMRNGLVQRFVEAIFPTTNPAVLLDQRMHNIIAYAESVENDFFERANSRVEYHQMLVKRINKIHEELDEKRQQRREQMQLVGDVKGQSEMEHASNQVKIKDWHKSNTPDLRKHSIDKIKQAICPIQNSTAVHGNQINSLNLLAQKIERGIYESAKSKAEYERLVDGRVSKIKKDIDERRKMMQKMPGSMQRFVGAIHRFPGAMQRSPGVMQRFQGVIPYFRPSPMQIKQTIYSNRIKSTNAPAQMLNVINNKDWRQSLTSDVRNSFVYKLLQAKFPDPAQLVDEDVSALIKDAKKIETDLHDKANSPTEYYALLLQKSIELRNMGKQSPPKSNGSQQKIPIRVYSSLI